MKYFFQRSFFCLFIFIVTHQSFAQSNYIEGYVVTLSQDTLRGLIDNKDWERNPKYIRFRKDLTTEPIVYYPWQINSFYLSTNEYYIGRSVSVDKSPVDVSRMTYQAPPLIVRDTLFLQASVVGKVSLYYYVDEGLKEHFYVQKEGIALDELIFKRMLNEQNQVVSSERYKGQLSFYLSDCPDAKKALEKVSFKLSQLQKLIADYNACIGSTATSGQYAKKLEKLAFRFGLLAGYSSTVIRFRGNNLENIRFNPSQSPLLGVKLNIQLPRNRRQWSIYNELLYRPYRVSDHNQLAKEKYFDLSYLKLVTMARWQYPIGLVRPFVNIGIANSFALASESNCLKDLRTYEQSLNGGIGATIKKISVEARLERGNGVSAYSNLSSPTLTCYMLLGYQF